jgi:hypothetical protein
MLMRSKTAEKYPEFRAYLYDRFPTVINSSKIAAEMELHGHMGFDKFRSALHPGAHPIIDVEEASAEPGTYYSCELGFLRGQTLLLYDPLVFPFNDDPWNQENMFKNANGQKVPVIGAVLLHFLCHWGRREDTATSTSTDAGYRFEKAVYGRRARLNLTSSMVNKLPSIV